MKKKLEHGVREKTSSRLIVICSSFIPFFLPQLKQMINTMTKQLFSFFVFFRFVCSQLL